MSTPKSLSITCAALALALVAATSAAAQMSGMAGMSSPAAAKSGTGVGVVKAVDPAASTVTLQHQAIPAIGWPAMTMAFKASRPAVLKAAKVGEKVRFDVTLRGSTAEVTAIRPAL